MSHPTVVAAPGPPANVEGRRRSADRRPTTDMPGKHCNAVWWVEGTRTGTELSFHLSQCAAPTRG
jgi:hypothetical protein